MRIWDVAGGRLILTLAPTGGGKVEGVAFSPDGRTLFVGNAKHLLTALPWDMTPEALASWEKDRYQYWLEANK